MPQVNVIDRPTLKNVIRPALDAKLAELSKELGLQITSGSATYGDTGTCQPHLNQLFKY